MNRSQLTEYIAVDLEMTGLAPARDKILEIGAVHMKNGQVAAEYQTLVNPRIPITEAITALTGITGKMAEGGADIRTALSGFLAFAGNLPLVGHNILYDYSFLMQNAVNLDLPFAAPVLDTLKLSRKLLTQPEKKTLESLCSYFHIVREQEHRALYDAWAAAQLLELLRNRYEEEYSELFCPKPLLLKTKKQGPATLSQKKYLKELAVYHKIELPAEIEGLTRSEASRLTDQILSQFGRAPKKEKTR